MASFRQIVAGRKQAARILQQEMRKVDSVVEKIQRKQSRMIVNKLKVPEANDLSELAAYGKELNAAFNAWTTQLNYSTQFFSAGEQNPGYVQYAK